MAKREIKLYKQSGDARWYAGEVKSHLIGVGASKRDDFEPTDTSNGVCFGLTIWWIIKSSQNTDFWSWMSGPGKQVAEIKAMFRAQRGEHDFTRFDEANKKICAETGMAKQCEVLMNQGTEFVHVGYYYISLRGKFGSGADESGHAIAAYIDPKGKCRYFDPNVGEYETDTLQETLVELSQLVRGYSITNLKIYWCCWK
jgi:hypothetical protein